MRVLVAVVLATLIAGAVVPAEAKVLVTINKSAQRMTVSVDGELAPQLGGFHGPRWA